MIVEVPEERIEGVPLTLLSGFLGAGKTTLLNHIIKSEHSSRLGVVVNDFGEIDIDAELVAKVDGETITLTNGCICCTIRDDLLLTLFRLLHRDDRPEHVLIEASGVSDPAQVVRGFAQAQMFDIVNVESVVAVVDAEQFGAIEYRDKPIALHQLIASDLVVLNKTDLVSPEQLAAVEARVRGTVPEARILRAEFGKVPADFVLGIGRFDPDRLLGVEPAEMHVHPVGDKQHTLHGGLDFRTFAWLSRKSVNIGVLQRTLDRLPASIYRAKGIVSVADEPRKVIVQAVGKRMEISFGEDWGDTPRESKIVAIGLGDIDADGIRAAFDACCGRPESARPKLWSWVRGLVAKD